MVLRPDLMTGDAWRGGGRKARATDPIAIVARRSASGDRAGGFVVGWPMYLSVDQARALMGGDSSGEDGLAWCAGCRENLSRHDEAWRRRGRVE